MYPMKPGKYARFKHGYGIEEKIFLENKAGYLKFYPDNKDKIKYLCPNKNYKFNLAYTYFLAETYTLLPFLERNKIPFVFVLYPGGGFGLNNKSSDKMLKEIFESKYFRKVITTQKATLDYLLRKNLCIKERIEHIFGGYSQFEKDEIPQKKYYKKDKDTFDICFVGAKYSPKGVDKGYDLFIETAKYLSKKYDDIKFHVVGGFNEEDIYAPSLMNRIIYYGYRQPDWLKDFYPMMDICLSPSRSNILYKGNFDGYPMGFEQSLFEVAMFCTDEVGNNDNFYIDGTDIVIIKPKSRDIINKIDFYYNNFEKLKDLSIRGKIKNKKTFDNEIRLDKVTKILETEAKIIG